MDEWIIDTIARGGYLGIALLMALENIFPPIPSELIMGVAGIAMARGQMAFWPLLFWGTLGSTLGNYVWFLIGDRLGYRRLRPFVERWGRWLTMNWRDVEKARDFFQGHGMWTVLAMRFSPFLRTLISLPAGLAHMGHWRFLALTFVGAGVWNALLIWGGSWAQHYIEEVHRFGGIAVMVLTVLTLLVYVWRVIRWRPE
jgi:membrane protein DedA with SNARE-associated domain